jgi:hypothetical protein
VLWFWLFCFCATEEEPQKEPFTDGTSKNLRVFFLND